MNVIIGIKSGKKKQIVLESRKVLFCSDFLNLNSNKK
jgi:hypothetical protein